MCKHIGGNVNKKYQNYIYSNFILKRFARLASPIDNNLVCWCTDENIMHSVQMFHSSND